MELVPISEKAAKRLQKLGIKPVVITSYAVRKDICDIFLDASTSPDVPVPVVKGDKKKKKRQPRTRMREFEVINLQPKRVRPGSRAGQFIAYMNAIPWPTGKTMSRDFIKKHDPTPWLPSSLVKMGVLRCVDKGYSR